MSWIEDPGIESFGSYVFSQLDIDQAFLNISSSASQDLYLYTLSSNCHSCPYQRVGTENDTISKSGDVHHMDAVYSTKYRLRTNGKDKTISHKANDASKYCEIGPVLLGEFGIYEIHASNQNPNEVTSPCSFKEIHPPVNIYYPLLIAFLVYLTYGIVFNLYKFIFRRNKNSASATTNSSTASTASTSRSNPSPSSQTNPSPGSGVPPAQDNVTNAAKYASLSRSSLTSTSIHPGGIPNQNPNGMGDHLSGGFEGHVLGGGNGNGGSMLTKKSGLSASQMSIASQRSSMIGPGSEYSSFVNGEPPYKLPMDSINAHNLGHGIYSGRNSVSNTDPMPVPAPMPMPIPAPNRPSRPASQQQQQQQPPPPQIRSPPPPPQVKQAQQTTTEQQPRPLQRPRLHSLDTFRGICITIMIFVNDGGAHYYFLEHAAWDGLYVADLVFPWFLWIMGVCIPVSIKSQRKRNTPRLKIFGKILVRSCKLIAIGLILASFGGPVELRELRLPGVLQRFGICYFFCSTLVLLYMNVNFTKPGAQNKFKAALQDVEIIWIGWIGILLFVVVHCLLTFFLTVPGCQTGYLGPGGLHEDGVWSEICIGGAAGYIDRQIFTEKHIYNWPTANMFYAEGDGKAYDPEGGLGTLTSLLQVWCGVQTGVTMLVYPKAWSRIKRWLLWALVLGGAGALLCGGKETGGWIPINKNLWSLSFVLVTSCFANVLLSALYFVIDIKKWWSGSPFFEPGMNSILLYVSHSIGHGALPFHWSYGRMATHAIRLLESLWGTTLWVILAIYWNHKKFFWTL